MLACYTPSLSCLEKDFIPFSEQRYDRYESETVRDRLTVFSMASAVKSCMIYTFSTAHVVRSYVYWNYLERYVCSVSSAEQSKNIL